MLKENLELTYESHYSSVIFSMLSAGERIIEIIRQFGITLEIFNDWCEKYPEFSEAVRKGVIDFHYTKFLRSRLENEDLWKPLRSATPDESRDHAKWVDV